MGNPVVCEVGQEVPQHVAVVDPGVAHSQPSVSGAAMLQSRWPAKHW
jgi:hypothetical protein